MWGYSFFEHLFRVGVEGNQQEFVSSCKVSHFDTSLGQQQHLWFSFWFHFEYFISSALVKKSKAASY